MSYFFLSRETITTDMIYDRNFEVYNDFKTKRNDESLKTDAYLFYSNQEYKEAIISFNTMTGEEMNSEDYFFLGISYMADKQMKEAIEILDELSIKSPEFQLRAEWYVALAYIKQGKKEVALSMLNKIISDHPASSYAKKSVIVIQDINQSK